MIRLFKALIRTLLVLTGIIPFLKCGSGYKSENGKASFDGKEITEKGLIVLNDAFAKDDSNAYYKENAISGADLPSFQALDNSYAKDKNRVYYCDEYREGQNYYLTKKQVVNTLPGAIPASFTVLTSGYAKDGARAYLDGHAFRVKDLSSLSVVNFQFVRDNLRVYHNKKEIPGSDGKTFRLIGDRYAGDIAHVYYVGQAGEVKNGVYVLPCDAQSFTPLDYPYSKDKSLVFFENGKIAGAEAASFQVLSHGFSKDLHNVYFRSAKLANADAASFTVYKENDEYTEFDHYAHDKDNIFFANSMLAQANLRLFNILGLGYASDGNQVFFKSSIVKDADVKSFKVYPHGMGDADAEDASHKYSQGKKVVEE